MAQPLSVSPLAASPRAELQPKLHSSSDQDFGKLLDSASRCVHEEKDPVVKPQTPHREQQSAGDISCEKIKPAQSKERAEGSDGSHPKTNDGVDDLKSSVGHVAVSEGPAKKGETSEKARHEEKMSPDDSCSSVTERVPPQDQQSNHPTVAAFNLAGSPVACGQILPEDGTNAKTATNVSTMPVTDCAVQGPEGWLLGHQLVSQQSGSRAPTAALDGISTLRPNGKGNPDSQEVHTAMHQQSNGEVKQLAEQTVSTQLNLPIAPDYKLVSVIPVAVKENMTATLDRHQLVTIQHDNLSKAIPSQDGGAQGATAGDFLQVQGQRAELGTGNAQAQVSVTAEASAKGNLLILSDSLHQPNPQVAEADLERNAVAKEGTADTAKATPQINEVILSQVGEPKDSSGMKADAILNARDVNRLVIEFNDNGKSKDPVQSSANALGSIPKPETATKDRVTMVGSATTGDDDGTQPELGKEETVMSSSERTVFSNFKSPSQQPAVSEGTAITREVSQDANAREAHPLTGFEANTTTDRVLRASAEKPSIKPQVVPEPGAPGNGGGFVSRTASFGGVDQSTMDRPATPGSAQFWTQAEKASVISQLIEKAHLVSASKNSELTISLKPEFLGRLSVHATMLDDSLVATITAESPAVKSLLESHIPNLQHSLQEQGLSVSKITVVQGNELSFSGYDYSHSSHHHNLESEQNSRAPWLNPNTPVEPDIEESEGLTERVFQPNQSIHLIA